MLSWWVNAPSRTQNTETVGCDATILGCIAEQHQRPILQPARCLVQSFGFNCRPAQPDLVKSTGSRHRKAGTPVIALPLSELPRSRVMLRTELAAISRPAQFPAPRPCGRLLRHPGGPRSASSARFPHPASRTNVPSFHPIRLYRRPNSRGICKSSSSPACYTWS